MHTALGIKWPGPARTAEIPIDAIIAYGGRRTTAPFIVNVGTRWRRVVGFTPPLHYNGGISH